eukprot:gene16699-8147_t
MATEGHEGQQMERLKVIRRENRAVVTKLQREAERVFHEQDGSEVTEVAARLESMKLLRSVAWVFRFIANIKARIKKFEPEVSSQVATEEIEKAENYVLKVVQELHVSKNIEESSNNEDTHLRKISELPQKDTQTLDRPRRNAAIIGELNRCYKVL